MLRLKSVLSSGLMLAVLVGCSKVESLPNMVPVSGTVTYNGAPLEQGTVAFAPEDIAKGQSAVGKIRNGNFKMMTTVSSPGAQIGRYKVAITSWEIIPDSARSAAGSPPPVKSLIPEKYTDMETSGFEIDVQPGIAPLMYELKN